MRTALVVFAPQSIPALIMVLNLPSNPTILALP